MTCHVGTSKYSSDAHEDRVLQLHDMKMKECICMCVKYFVLIIWWLTIFKKCVFDVSNVGRSLAFINNLRTAKYFLKHAGQHKRVWQGHNTSVGREDQLVYLN